MYYLKAPQNGLHYSLSERIVIVDTFCVIRDAVMMEAIIYRPKHQNKMKLQEDNVTD